MNHDVALTVYQARKTFGKTQNRAWRKRLRRNGKGAEDKAKRQVVAVNDVSLEVRRGEIFGILGPNGSGKSTLVRLVATLLQPDGGTITVFGHDVQREEMAVKRLINRVSVEASFFKKLSPMENLLYAIWLAINWQQGRGPGRACPERGRRVLRWVVIQLAVVALYWPWLPTAYRQVSNWPSISQSYGLLFVVE